jgi:hypothetical protein
MCRSGKTMLCYVPIPGRLSHTGERRWSWKPVDWCIAELVCELNRAGELTAGSCCGHRRGAPGSVVFHDGRDLTVKEATGLLSTHGVVLQKHIHPADPSRGDGTGSVYYPERDQFRDFSRPSHRARSLGET